MQLFILKYVTIASWLDIVFVEVKLQELIEERKSLATELEAAEQIIQGIQRGEYRVNGLDSEAYFLHTEVMFLAWLKWATCLIKMC